MKKTMVIQVLALAAGGSLFGQQAVPASRPDPEQAKLAVADASGPVSAQAAWCPSSVPYGNNPATGRFATLNGIRLYYEIYGRGQTLVLMHGNGGAIDRMGCQIAKFSPGRMVIAVDSRGHGKSADGNERLTFEQQADDVAAVLEHEHIDSADILGQSDGGILALLVAIRHPDRVRRVIASAPNLWPDDSALLPSAIARMKAEMAEVEVKVASGDKSRDWVRRKRQIELDLYEPHISLQQIRSIQAPTLLVGADADVIRLEHYLEIFRNLPRGQLFVLPGATHGGATGIMSSQLFNAVAARFLDEPFSRPR